MDRGAGRGAADPAQYVAAEDVAAEEEAAKAVGGKASQMASALNLGNTVAGAGLLLLPFAVSQQGWLLGGLMLSLAGFLASYSMRLITVAAAKAQVFSFKQLAIVSMGRGGAFLVDAIISVYTLGSGIAYMVLLSRLIPFCVYEVTGVVVPRVQSLVAVWTLLLVPLSLLKDMRALRFTSAAALVILLYTVGLLVVNFLVGSGGRGHKSIVPISSDPLSIFLAMPIMSVSFTGHYLVAPMYYELQNRSVHRMRRVIKNAMSGVYLLYIVAAMSGYLAFGEHIQGDVLEAFGELPILSLKGATVMVARAGMVFVVAFSFPLIFFGCRSAWIAWIMGPRPVSYKFTVVGSMILLLAELGVASLTDDIAGVFAFNGALFGNTIVFILPAIFYVRIVEGPFSRPDKMAALALLCIGCVLTVFGVAAATYRLLSD